MGHLQGLVPGRSEDTGIVGSLYPGNTLDRSGMFCHSRGLVGLKVPHLTGLIT